MKINENFRSVFSETEIADLEKNRDVIYACDENLKLVFFNTAWEIFARENGGLEIINKYSIGTDIKEVFKNPYKHFYIEKYKDVINKGILFEQDYECSSVKTFRTFHQTVIPIKSGKGLVIKNSLTVSLPHVYEDYSHHHHSHFLPYIDSAGAICQCVNCRKVKNFDVEEKWDWVPHFIKHPHNKITNVFCPVCKLQYYPKLDCN